MRTCCVMLALVLTGCGPGNIGKPPAPDSTQVALSSAPSPPPPPPEPETARAAALSRKAFGPEPLSPRPAPPEIINVWTTGRTAADLARVRRCCTTAEVLVPLDPYWDPRILAGPGGAWRWLSTEREWAPFDASSCPYSLADTLLALTHGGVLIELTIDTQALCRWDNGRWRDWYHRDRLNPVLAGDDTYVIAVRQILRACFEHGVRIHRIWVENEPSYGGAFTLDTYLRRVRRVAAMRDALCGRAGEPWCSVQIGAGATEPDWGIAAWKTGRVDRVGYHVVNTAPGDDQGVVHGGVRSREWETAQHATARMAFTEAGVPLDRVIADEVISPYPVKFALAETVGRSMGGLGWTAFTSDRGCSPAWALSQTGRWRELRDAGLVP